MTESAKASLRVSVEKKAYAADGKEVTVLSDIRFAADENEFLVITGPSGCGKTTLLNLISGLDTVYQGQISLPPEEAGRLPLSFVFQDPRLLPWRTVKQNIDLVLPPGTDPMKTAGLLRQMGIEDALDRYPSEISLGMSRRVALARAFSANAPLLLMDEPFASIDELTATRLRALLLRQWRASPHLVLFVTHNIREALYLGCRLLVLSARPTRLIGDIALPGEPGRPVEEVEDLYAYLVRRFPEVLG